MFEGLSRNKLRSHIRLFELGSAVASHFAMNGGNILVLQRILGYSSLTMRYAYLAPEHLQEAWLLNPFTKLSTENLGCHFVVSQRKRPALLQVLVLVPIIGFELMTYRLQGGCSTN